jgi:outer membrane protein OmpA-like peptidoglycan-associated protein/Tol biopolymer transport system component
MLLLGCFSVFSCKVSAQSGQTVEQLNKRQQKLYEEIRADNNRGALSQALEGLNKLLEDALNFTEGYHFRGTVHYDLKNYEAAEADLEKALALDANYDPIVRYQLALSEKELGKYTEAKGHLQSFLKSGYDREAILERAKKHLADAEFAEVAVRNPVPFDPENVGAPISSDQPEYLPVLSADGQTMIFTRRVRNQEDFFVAEKENGVWKNAQPLESLNTPFNEGAQSISADGRLMVFTFCQSQPGDGGCNLFYSEKCDGNWSKPQKLEGEVSTKYWEAQPTLSADGSLLLFASDRPGGQGGIDIWACRRSRSGKWGKPVNLGPGINTAGNDQCPFLHADGRSFYFCSDGRPGMGGNDLYFVRLQEDGQWGEVKNLGYPINTPGNEGTLTVSLDGETAYFAKSPDSVEDLDIFSFPLYAEARPLPVTYVQGKIFDSKTGDPLSARAELVDLSTNRPVAYVNSCADGSYLVCLPAGKNYGLHVDKDNYLFFSEHFALEDQANAQPFELDVPLQQIKEEAPESTEESKPVILKNVFFASGSAELLPESTNELDRLHDLLNDHPELRIQINGHTDDVGSDEDNILLSEARAKAVYDYLVEKGIAEDRLRYKGFGETKPIADNATAEGKQTNRRTEFERW